MLTQRLAVRAAFGAVVAIAAVMFTACDPAVEPPNWRARVVDDSLELAICQQITGDEIGVDIDAGDGSRRWEAYWEATGTFEAQAGTVITAGSDAIGLTTRLYHPTPLPAGSKSFVVFVYRDGQQIERAAFTFDENSPADYWSAPVPSGGGSSPPDASIEPCE